MEYNDNKDGTYSCKPEEKVLMGVDANTCHSIADEVNKNKLTPIFCEIIKNANYGYYTYDYHGTLSMYQAEIFRSLGYKVETIEKGLIRFYWNNPYKIM